MVIFVEIYFLKIVFRILGRMRLINPLLKCTWCYAGGIISLSCEILPLKRQLVFRYRDQQQVGENLIESR